ncbi:MAG: HAD hydrolase-like protein [Treponema sp.]|nr:HAD hydrolase-like protein [Treponema sp.]
MTFKHIIFDLDNTLYPSSSAMDSGITRRMLECVADFFGCSMERAIELRKERIVHFSTTLEWLRSEGLTDIEKFLAHVHPDNEADELMEQPGLRDFLLSIPVPFSILTNSPHEHADRVLAKLGIDDLPIAVTDIRDADFFGKPWPKSYLAALKKAGTNIEETLFIDDMQKYTDGWCALGGTSVLIGEKNGKPLADDAESMKAAKRLYREMKMQAGGNNQSDRENQSTAPALPGKTIRLNSIYELKGTLI